MARTIGSVEIRDTNTHLIHDVKPDPSTDVILDVVNNLNLTVDVEFVGSRDDDTNMDEAVVLDTGKNVPAGDAGHYTFSEPWERIGVRLSTNQAPSSGEVIVYIVA